MPKKFVDGKDSVLLEIYRFIRISDGQIYVSSSDIEPNCDSSFSKSYITVMMKSLVKTNYLEVTKADGEEVYAITDPGITRAEKIIETRELWPEFDSIETSVGEIIDLDQNDEIVKQIKADLDQVSEKLVSGNDVGDLTAEQIESAKAEVTALRAMFEGARVRAGVAATQARQTLSWISEKAGAAVVGELAKNLLRTILAFLGYGG